MFFQNWFNKVVRDTKIAFLVNYIAYYYVPILNKK
jgi:hypothetical protein